jgi:pantoate--beta-alanine ligase
MLTATSLSKLRAMRASMKGTFGLVPTMGALHDGHCSLVKRARTECEYVGVSIFVNPTQFSPGEDFEKYPRTIQVDLDLLEDLGVDVVWMPAAEEIYPKGFQTWITVDKLTERLEGQSRPGHFRGVTTIVAKLFNSFLPDRAYFGQKDAQQVVVLKRMAKDLNFAVELVVCPTVRETDGLALSSRNAYLGSSEREAATVLYRSLNAAKAEYDRGERNADALREVMRTVIKSEPLASEEYISAADAETLCELQKIEGRVLLSLAVRIGKTRLIDNLLI